MWCIRYAPDVRMPAQSRTDSPPIAGTKYLLKPYLRVSFRSGASGNEGIRRFSFAVTQMRLPKSRTAGQSAIELIGGTIVIIPLVLFGIDCVTVYMGQNLNTQVCRDAARAASKGPPSAIFPNSPQQRAELVVRRSQKTEGAIRLSPNVIVTENVRPPLPVMPFGGSVDGEVTVETTVDVYPPFLLHGVVRNGAVTIKAKQTFPFTWVMENQAATNLRNLSTPLAPVGRPQPTPPEL